MFIGRIKETESLKRAFQDDYSHFIAVYGRRRIGKTFLVRETFGYRFTFQHAGMAEGGLKDQLFAFDSSLKDAGFTVEKSSTSWMEAFEKLKDLIRNSSEKRKIVFIDELSWMDTPKSNLLSALENFWNGFASARRDVILIVCASATSWMLSKVIHNKGGLYNRLTAQIHLQPFSLAECEEYVNASGMIMNRDQILHYYMVFGGVPYYWGFLEKGKSVDQNIDSLLFAADAPLKEEFKYLYSSIFKRPEVYLKIVKTLAGRKSGLTRTELIDLTGIGNTGDLSHKLEELESCGFIRKYNCFGKKSKDAVYRLVDAFTLFYYQFMKKMPTDENYWENQINTPTVNTWKGLSFERVCMDHIGQIKKKLGISGVLTDINSLYCKADPDKGIFGSQIDLLIARKDQVINLCEMKYSSTEYIVSKSDSQSFSRKIHDLVQITGTKYAIFPTLITTFGMVENSWSGEIQSVVTMDDLFEKV